MDRLRDTILTMKLKLYFWCSPHDRTPGKIRDVAKASEESWDIRRALENFAMDQLMWLNNHPDGRIELKWVP